MSMQIHLNHPVTGKEYHFSPARDIAYFWPQLIEHAYDGLLENRWESWYGDYLKSTGTTEADVLAALVAYSKFCMLAVKTELQTPAVALEEAGWFKCTLPAQLVVCTKLGQLCTGFFWAGIRSATPMGEIPCEIEQLVTHATQLELELSSRATEDTISTRSTFGAIRIALIKGWRYFRRCARQAVYALRKSS